MSETNLAEQSSTGTKELTPQKMLSLGLLWPAEVDRICAEEQTCKFIVEGFLPTRSLAIIAGDSTIGKSPLAYLLALSIASGTAFLGMSTRQGRVIYVDLENPTPDSQALRDSIVRFLGLPNVPGDFLTALDSSISLESRLEAAKPELVIIDSVRTFRPEATRDNTRAAEWLNELRKLSHKYGCTFLLIHHLRKPNENRALPNVEECSVVAWLQEMEGPRALVNQTDVRVGVDTGDMNPAALKVKWNRRVYGDSPLTLLERVFEDDAPVGYRLLTGLDFLRSDKRQAFLGLPREFTFKQAKEAFGLSDDPTNKTLEHCKSLGLVERVARGRYRKRGG